MDLNITIYEEDAKKLLEGNIIERRDARKLSRLWLDDKAKRDLFIKERKIEQYKFQFNTEHFYLEGYHNEPEIITILGWDIVLKKQTFGDYIKETDDESRVEPFWGRGIQFHCHFDRVHITYRNL